MMIWNLKGVLTVSLTMVATIAQIIGKVNPKFYAENGDDLLKEFGSVSAINSDKIKDKPLSTHSFVYDSSSETLEPVYFFILDLMKDFGLDTEKLIDNFSSSPGSGHFAELGQRATVMQQQGAKILGDVNTVMRSVLNIIYDLKEFRIRLDAYDALKTDKKEAAILSLKQLWMDKVDWNKGNSSIKAMALGQAGFQTLISAFLFVKTVEEIEKVDLNEVVKRILRARVFEFNDWLGQSEKELRKRYELEKTYLRSQVNSLKLYARWAKPYLKAAQDLEMKEQGREPALVKTFNTIILELSLLGKKKIKVHDEVMSGNFPKDVEKITTQDYYSCTLVDFRFRGIPQRISQQSHYVFGGRAEISFKSYVLTGDEIKKLNEELDSSDVGDVLRLIEGSTGESMAQLQDEINSFLDEKEDSNSSMKQEDNSNPFKALFGGYDDTETPKKEGKKADKETPEKAPGYFSNLFGALAGEPPRMQGNGKGKKEKIKLRPDNYVEKEYIRKLAETNAQEQTFKVFDTYKKAHGMPSYT